MIGGADGRLSPRPSSPDDGAQPKTSSSKRKERPVDPPPSSLSQKSFDPVKHSTISSEQAPTSIQPHQMSHRVEPYPVHPHKRPSYHNVEGGRPSPPPIATLPHTVSPSPPVSSQHGSPAMHGRNNLPGMGYYEQRGPPPPPHMSAPQYSYGPPPPHPVYHGDGGYPPNGMPPMMAHQMPPPRGPPGPDYAMTFPGSQTGLPVIHTDDAATKLSDRVRRRCFNCCTTDTSTWRRSNLSPGKVLCNKCGLFERTHSRPRPEQFPHKRGPLASAALAQRGGGGGGSRGQAPPQGPPPQQILPTGPPPNGHPPPMHNNQLPPIQHQNGAPYGSGYSIPPIQDGKPSSSKTLPEINSWMDRGDDRRQPPPQGERHSPKNLADTNSRDDVTLPRLELKEGS